MKIKKLGYTMIEMLLVTILIGIVGAIFRDSFKPKNKDILYGEACVNNIYGDISSFINSALTSKSILSGTERISPSKFFIDINPDNNSLSLTYNKPNDATNYTYKVLNLTGKMPPTYYCSNSVYTMIFSGNHTIVQINKGIKETQELRSFSITNRPSFQETIYLKLCPSDNNSLQYDKCKELGIYEINTSIQNIKRKNCLNIQTGGNCIEWSQ